MSTYAEVISSNPSYSAKRYASRIPYAIAAPLISGLALILLFFFVPWFSTGEPATSIISTATHDPINISAITVGTSGVNITKQVINNDGSGGRLVNDSYGFPFIWAILVVGIAQVVLALLVLKDRMLPRWLAISIRVSFLAAFISELAFFATAFFLAFVKIKSAGGQIATFPASGFWLSLLITIITCIVSFVIMPGLVWCWTLARNDMARATRIEGLRLQNNPGSTAGAGF